MTDINNLVDFGEVFNAIRQEQRELIKAAIVAMCHEVCQVTHPDGSANLCDDHNPVVELIDDLPLPGGEQE